MARRKNNLVHRMGEIDDGDLITDKELVEAERCSELGCGECSSFAPYIARIREAERLLEASFQTTAITAYFGRVRQP